MPVTKPVEVWKPIAGFPGYSVSSLGRVESYKRNRVKLLRLRPNKQGYPVVWLGFGETRGKQFKVHILVLEAFVGPRPAGALGLHRNDVKTDNEIGNLYWGTYSQNGKDRFSNGRMCSVGVLNGRAKLLPDKQKIARKMRIDGSSYEKIGKELGVCAATISHFFNGRTWV